MTRSQFHQLVVLSFHCSLLIGKMHITMIKVTQLPLWTLKVLWAPDTGPTEAAGQTHCCSLKQTLSSYPCYLTSHISHSPSAHSIQVGTWSSFSLQTHPAYAQEAWASCPEMLLPQTFASHSGVHKYHLRAAIT